MHDIGELQRRIISALDRIGTGIDGLAASTDQVPPDRDVEALEAALDDERTAAAQLRERLDTVTAERDSQLDAARGALAEAQALLHEIEEDRNRLKVANEALSTAARSLREANAQGLADAGLVNGTALAEIETLKTMRDSDRAELEALMRVIAPVVDREGNASNA